MKTSGDRGARDTPEGFLAEIEAHRPSLAEQVRAGLPDLAVAAGPLLQMLRAELDAPGEDDAVVAAARLLGAWRRTEAIPLLLELLEAIDPEDYLYSAAIFALGDIGAPAVEPLLAAWPDAEEDFGNAIADALVQTGVKDDRILEILLGTLGDSDLLGATLLGQYGDPLALPALSRALDAFEVDPSSRLGNIGIFDLEGSIRDLGGGLSAAQKEKLAQARAVGAPARKQEHPGRNDPCWCGSGKKYKRCHLDGDRGDA